MPATTPTVLARVMDAIAENLATIQVVGGGAQLFGGSGVPADWNVPDGPGRLSRIYLQGEAVPAGGPFPLCVIRFDDEEFDQQTTTRTHFLPWSVDVVFDRNPLTEPDAHPTLHDIHTNLFGLIRDHFGTDANRRLPQAGFGSTVVDNSFDGGGAQLIPQDEDAQGDLGPAIFVFSVNYRAHFRTVPGDSTTPA